MAIVSGDRRMACMASRHPSISSCHWSGVSIVDISFLSFRAISVPPTLMATPLIAYFASVAFSRIVNAGLGDG